MSYNCVLYVSTQTQSCISKSPPQPPNLLAVAMRCTDRKYPCTQYTSILVVLELMVQLTANAARLAEDWLMLGLVWSLFSRLETRAFQFGLHWHHRRHWNKGVGGGRRREWTEEGMGLWLRNWNAPQSFSLFHSCFTIDRNEKYDEIWMLFGVYIHGHCCIQQLLFLPLEQCSRLRTEVGATVDRQDKAKHVAVAYCTSSCSIQ